MEKVSDFEIKYWAGGNDFSYEPDNPKPKRSFKKKLFIVFSFVAFLAVTPSIIFGLSRLSVNEATQIARVESPKTTSEKEAKTSQPATQTVEVINNDSYWKISKRVCGTGKNYLSVRDQNEGKALYKGDSVTVSCNLN